MRMLMWVGIKRIDPAIISLCCGCHILHARTFAICDGQAHGRPVQWVIESYG